MLREKDLDLPFIVVSGAIGEETAVAAMKSGVHDYIMKDNLKRLVPAIERELREAEGRRERRRAQQALAESEERYRSLVENLDMGITLIDPDFTVVMLNAARAKMIVAPETHGIGQKCFRTLENRGTVCPQCPAVSAMSTGQPVEADWEGVRKGEFRVMRIRAFPTFAPDRSVTGCIEVMEDITVRKRLEQQLRQAAQMEAIGRLAGGVAHDFNNLLTAMIGYSNVLLQQMAQDNPYRDKVVQITYAAERAAGLTRQLLAFGRKQVLDVKVLDLNPVIANFQKMLRRLVGEDVDLTTVLLPSVARVKADRSQIEQILMNLSVNARDAMPRGGSLTLSTREVILDTEYARIHPHVAPGPYVVFSVSDTGTGMDLDTVSQIFDPFFTTKEEGKGTGLGLSTVYGIVKQHQGHVSVDSEPGQGTTFHVYLPMCSEAPDEAEDMVSIEPQRGGDETVMVVEDEEIVRNVACEVLEMLGYTVFSAAEPETALKISQQHQGPIHLLLADVVLPRMDGASLFSRLSSTRSETRVLYVSGYPERSFIRRGVLTPGTDFLQKPFSFESLGHKVREVLDKPMNPVVQGSHMG